MECQGSDIDLVDQLVRSDSEPMSQDGNHLGSGIEHVISKCDSRSVGPVHTCCICGKIFKQKAGLTKHLRLHTSESMISAGPYGPYKCTVCGEYFTRLDYMKAHKRTHTGEKPYKCDACDKCFTQRSSLNTHKRIHEYAHTCFLCGEFFEHRSKLIDHAQTHTRDTAETLYKCEHCGKCFAEHDQLNKHQHNVHLIGGKPYTCKQCLGSFTWKYELTQHKCEKSKKLYKCEFCGKGFAQHDVLLAHELTHKCKYCGKGFARRDALTIHERVHTGEKPYKCKQCSRSFADRPQLTRHKCSKSVGTDTGKCVGSERYETGFAETCIKTEEDDLSIKEEPIELYIKTEKEESITKEEPTAVIIKTEKEENITKEEPTTVIIKTEKEESITKEEPITVIIKTVKEETIIKEEPITVIIKTVKEETTINEEPIDQEEAMIFCQ